MFKYFEQAFCCNVTRALFLGRNEINFLNSTPDVLKRVAPENIENSEQNAKFQVKISFLEEQNRLLKSIPELSVTTA